MDHDVTISAPVESVFTALVDPARLVRWLPQVLDVRSVPAPPVGTGATFLVSFHQAGSDHDVDAEVVAHEPPWLIAYRLMAPSGPALIRVTCTTTTHGTRVHVQQAEGPEPLSVDLIGLAEVVDGPARIETPEPASSSAPADPTPPHRDRGDSR